ncbi:MAG: GNAT family N-acetyltransferase [Anaerolineales bacterium]|nr:GNAT family N-acetyltransferase [Anaerolineales bacterium]
MKIRQAVQEDVEALSRLNAHVQRLHAEAHPDQFKMPEKDDFAVAFFRSMMENPEIFIYIAEEEQPLGYIILRVVHREETPFMVAWDMLYIDQIGVQPEFQGKGVGKALMAQAERQAAQEGLDMVALDSWGFNTQAHDFFHSQGYQEYNLRMWKKLTK